MTKRDLEIIATGFAASEKLAMAFDVGDVTSDGLVLAALQFAQGTIAAGIAAEHPRFSKAEFEMACFPLTYAEKASRAKASLGAAAS